MTSINVLRYRQISMFRLKKLYTILFQLVLFFAYVAMLLHLISQLILTVNSKGCLCSNIMTLDWLFI